MNVFRQGSTIFCNFDGRVGGDTLAKFKIQCCNEDQKWTKDEDEESSGSQKRPKTKTKILRKFEKSLKTFEDRNFLEDIRRIEDFCRNMKENMQSEKYVS